MDEIWAFTCCEALGLDEELAPFGTGGRPAAEERMATCRGFVDCFGYAEGLQADGGKCGGLATGALLFVFLELEPME